MNNALQKVIFQLYELVDPTTVEQGKLIVGPNREKAKKEIIDFLSYLSASDGTIAKYEASFISDYLDEFYSAEKLKEHIEKANTYSAEFEQTVPEILQLLVEDDNEVYQKNNSLTVSKAKSFCSVYDAIGKEFLVCDGEASENEVKDFTIYTSMLADYVKTALNAPFDTPSSIDTSIVHAGEHVPEFDEDGEPIPTLEELLEELNSLIGLHIVKKDVNSLIHLQQIQRIRAQRGLKAIPVSNHLVFYGNPGTGKTTVARLLAKIYHSMGILSKGQLIEVDRSGLVAGYVGQTALKVQEVVKSALGGVLFIDEAYALTYSSSSNDYGQEAIDTLLKAMEDNRDDFVVIVAGYPELMAQFIDSNPGLRSRFNKYINFEDYTVSDLTEIFKVMCHKAGYTISNEALCFTSETFEKKYKNRGKNFANAREVRNFFEKAIMNQADRLFNCIAPSDQQLSTLEIVDLHDIY